jgi:hypothetical protein
MGWSSGTDLVRKVAESIRSTVVEPQDRKQLYLDLVSAAEDCDWDCQNEAEGIDPILDRILRRR